MLGNLFIASIVQSNDIQRFTSMGDISPLFKASEKQVYEFVNSFLSEHFKIPDAFTIAAHTGVSLPDAIEPPSYYLGLMVSRHIELTLKKAVADAKPYFAMDAKNPEKALTIFSQAVSELIHAQFGTKVVDFRKGQAIIQQSLVDMVSEGDNPSSRLMFGWKTLDSMSNGFRKGDLVSFVGRPSAGKTTLMLKSAYHGWNANKESTNASRLFISMEMDVLAIHQRLIAMHSKIPMDFFKAYPVTIHLKKLMEGFAEIEGYASPFWIVDGNLTATVEDIEHLAAQLNPAAIFIDGGYLLKSRHEHDRYRRVASNVELIKSSLCSRVPVVASWQFARANKSLKSDSKIGLDNIGYTDAIAQVSSTVVGWFQDESVETIVQRKADILKGRNGELGSFCVNWDWKTMNFDEVSASENKGDLEH